MQQRKTTLFAALLLVLAVACASPRQAAAQENRFVFMDEPVVPYTYGDEGGVCEKGLTKDIFDILFGRLGLRYEIRLMPWARVMDSARNGDCDGVTLLIRNPEREAFLHFTDPVVENREMLYYLPERLGDFQWNRLEDLKALRIGLVRGYTYDDDFQEAVERLGIRITYGSNSKMILTMLEAGRVDAVVEDETLAGPILSRHPDWARRITAAKKPISTYYWSIGINRRSPLVEHLDAINRTLKAMRADGSLKKILDKRLVGPEAQ